MDRISGGWPVKMVDKVEGFDAAFDDFLKHASGLLTEYMRKEFPTLEMPVLKAYEGGRYVKVVKEETHSRSVWAFVDKTNGDVLKPAGWNAPAKNARANVLDRASWRNVGPYGPAYMRNMAASELLKIAKELVGSFDKAELMEDIGRAMRSIPGVRTTKVYAAGIYVMTEGGGSFSVGTKDNDLDFGSSPEFWVIDTSTGKKKTTRVDLTEDKEVARNILDFIYDSF